MKDERGSWYLLTGLFLGLAIGLVFAWVIAPRTYGDTSPAFLRADFKDRYRAMIAVAFAANGNLPRAQARLNFALRDPDVIQVLADQAQRMRAGGSPSQEVLALERLAEALRSQPVGLPPTRDPSGTVPPAPGSPVSIVLPVVAVTPTPLLPQTSTPASQGPFVLQEQTLVCDQTLSEPLIQVFTRDQAGRPVSGVEVVVRWEGGEDHFYTGLKPEMGLDYADFRMQPGTDYTLKLALGGQVSDLAAGECETDNGSSYWGSWLLVFTRP